MQEIAEETTQTQTGVTISVKRHCEPQAKQSRKYNKEFTYWIAAPAARNDGQASFRQGLNRCTPNGEYYCFFNLGSYKSNHATLMKIVYAKLFTNI